jgi:hypothetical protein
MTAGTREEELEALKANIARLRDEFTALAAGVKEFARTKSAESHGKWDHETAQHECSENGEEGPGAWTDVFHALNAARAQSEKVAKNIAAEIERHPLVGSAAAFGLGFFIAKLWYRGSKP